MTVRGRRAVLGILAFALLYLVALAFSIPKIENNLTDNVTQQLVAGGVTGVAVSFSGRDGTLTGPLATKDAALAAVADRWGIRSLTYESSGAEVVVPSTTEPSTSTAEVTTTSAASTTTIAATTTTVSATTTTAAQTTTTAAPVTYTDATATISDQTITLSGTVASNREAQTLSDAATAGFALQGTVVNQVTVKPQTAPPAIDRAVDGLAAFITAASPSLFNGSGHLVNQGLAVQGEAFSAAAATAFNNAVAAAATQYGLDVTGTASPGSSSPNDLQPYLTALVGRSGVNFASGSATLDQPSQVVLNSVAATINQVPGAQVQIVGYTDSDGTTESNLTLSQERADAVKTYLVGQGVPADSLTTLGKGEADPIAPNDTPENKAKNRRIELIVQGS
jgi:outer membrane protein OmpA-like peptidoglycan-associated protein